MKNTVVIVSCYGLMHESRTNEEIDGLDQYIRSFCEYIKSLDTKPTAIVLCGGRTAPEVSAESESESFLRYIAAHDLLDQYHVVCETTSHNAPEQIVFGVAHVRKIINEDTTLLFICDTVRFEKVSLEANILLGDLFDIEVQGFDRKDIHPNSSREYQMFTALPNDLKNPEFEFLKHWIQSVSVQNVMENQDDDNWQEDEEDIEINSSTTNSTHETNSLPQE